MAQKYKGTFDIPGGFGNKGGTPISDDMVVEKFNDLLNLEALPFVYPGMIVYSEAEDAHFTWNGLDRTQPANWNQLGGLFINTSTPPVTIGGYNSGEPATPPKGLSLQASLNKLLFPATQPSISFNVSSQLIEKGTNFSQTVNIAFSKNDAGSLISYFLEKNGVEISINQSTLVEQIPVSSSFSLRARASYEASNKVSAGTINTGLATITPKIPQWKGSKTSNASMNGLTRDQIVSQFGQPNIISNYDKGINNVPANNYGFFLSSNSNAKIISDETGLPLAEGGAYNKSTINIVLKDGSNANLTEYIINTAQGDFKYYIE